MEANGTPILWHLKVSHYNEKARWALDYKGIPHVRRDLIPGRHHATAEKLAGVRTFPVLVMNGKAVGDSTRIIEELERTHPDPPLYPKDAQALRHALALEEFWDEELGPFVRRIVVHHLIEEPDLFLHTFVPDSTRARRLLVRPIFGRIKREVDADIQIDDARVEQAYLKVREAGERFRAELWPSGYLGSDSFGIADLTLAALVAPAVAPEQYPYPQPQRGHPLLAPIRDALAEHGILDWARDMYARHRSSSAEIVQ